MFNNIFFIYKHEGDYTSKFHPCPLSLSLSLIDNAKIQRKFDITKYFVLKGVNHMLRSIICLWAKKDGYQATSF